MVYATRRERVDSSSSDDDCGHHSSADLRATALPEEQAVKERGLQARPGPSIERLSKMRRRRRGEYRLRKVSPPVVTLTIRYRDELWWARQRKDVDAQSSNVVASNMESAGADRNVKLESGATLKREPGETARAPDGKRRQLSMASHVHEIVVVSD